MKNPLKTFYHNWERKKATKKMAASSHIMTIGVTGSYGKTSTSVAITSVLSEKFKTLQTDLNLDTNYNVPKTVLKLHDQTHLVMELGVDHKDEMLHHLEIVHPSVAVITGIAPVHADKEHLGSLEGIVEEKGRLLEKLPSSGWAVMNWDDKNVRDMVNKTKAHVIRYGLNKSHCNLFAEDIKVGFDGTTMVIKSQKFANFEDINFRVSTPLIGKQHAYTILAAAAVGLLCGLSPREVASGLTKLQPLEGRLSIEKGPLGMILINDARRANLASTLAGLEVLKDLPGKRKIAILGQMSEMGKYEESGHREVGMKAIETRPDLLVCVGGATKYIFEEASKGLEEGRVLYVRDVFEAADRLKPIIQPGDLVYLKGSLLRHMERILLLLDGKQVESDEKAFKRYQVYR